MKAGFLLTPAALVLLASSSFGTTIYVNGATGNNNWNGLCEVWEGGTCGPKATIQAGINAAPAGDEVVIADGTYTGTGNKDLDLHGKAVTVRSASDDPAMCIIDCEGVGRGFYFHNGEGLDSIVQGLTITNGVAPSSAGRGGGVYCLNSSPTLTNCTISQCEGTSGGSICCYGSSPAITHCALVGNLDAGVACNDGSDAALSDCIITQNVDGGIHSYSSSPTVSRCTISQNTAVEHGGGIRASYSNPTLSGCTISENSAPKLGGGLYCTYSTVTLTNCTISRNYAEHGGGINCSWSSDLTLSGCTVSDNSATDNGGTGGGVSNTDPIRGTARDSETRYYDCTFTGNAAEEGGAVSCVDVASGCTFIGNSAYFGGAIGGWGTPMITNCVFRSNEAWLGGAIYSNDLDPTITNCTFRDNFAGTGGALYGQGDGDRTLTNCVLRGDTPDEIYVTSGSPVVTYSNVDGGWSGTGNIDADPLFAFAEDAHLTLGSPCIDSGTNAPAGGLPANDLDGTARPLDGDGDMTATADMGACEFDADTPRIVLERSAIVFSGTEGGANPADQILSLRNCGGGTLNWDITGQPTWLTALPTGGDSTGEVDDVLLSVDTTGLTHGSYYATLEVADPLAANSPQTVTVTLFVTKTLNVPVGYATIQAAIDASVDGDVVQLEDGVYTGLGNKDLDFGGRAITVRSASGDPALCVIDCEGAGCGFCFSNGEGSDAIVEGLTISNGRGYDTGDGYTRGGGVYCWQSSPTFQDCVISRNAVTKAGGGVYCKVSNPTLNHCTISGNSAMYEGGGVSCYDESSAMLNNCTVKSNAAGYVAGGVQAYCSDPILTDCTIVDNLAYSGGGVGLSWAYATLTNCLIRENCAAERGGAIWALASYPRITNCTLFGNSASLEGGAIGGSNATPILANCILWGNTPDEIAAAEPQLTYCDVQGGWSGEGNIDVDPQFAFEGEDFHLVAGSPCIDAGTNTPTYGLPASDPDGNARPLDGDGDLTATADMGIYEFNADAPSIALDATTVEFFAPEGDGDPADQWLLLRNCGGDTLDWEVTGQPAWLTVAPSSGQSAGEVRELLLSVNATGLTHGMYAATLAVADPLAVNSPREVRVSLCITSTLAVPSTYSTIQAALDDAVDGDVVELADSTYAGFGNRNLDFGGKRVNVRSASGDPALCVVDCQNDGCGFYFHNGEGAESVVEGLTITNGSGYVDDGGNTIGGGVYCRNSNPTITDCVITVNAADDGAGIYCEVSSPTLTDCTISGNAATGTGGGLCCPYGSSPTLIDCEITGNGASEGAGVYCYYYAHPTFTDCAISTNTATANGGALFCYRVCDPILTHCSLNGNWADERGGAVYCGYYSDPALDNCTLAENWSIRGSGVYCRGYSYPTLLSCRLVANLSTVVFCDYYGTPRLRNCTLSGNSGTAVYCYSQGRPTVTNCILWGDTGDEINVYSGTATVTYCLVEGGWTGDGNIDADPLLVDWDGPDDDPLTWEDNDYHLATSSPCIGSGDPQSFGVGELDMDGEPRVMGGRVDIGADEVTDRPFVFGDMNCDGVRDNFDIDAFVLALTSAADDPPFDSYYAQYPDCEGMNADVNDDGSVNNFDIDAFVTFLIGG